MSAEFGKHLLEVEDLLQKHRLMEADIAIQGDKVKAITAATLQFTEGKGEAKNAPLLRPLMLNPTLGALPPLGYTTFRVLPLSSGDIVQNLKGSSALLRASCFGSP